MRTTEQIKGGSKSLRYIERRIPSPRFAFLIRSLEYLIRRQAAANQNARTSDEKIIQLVEKKYELRHWITSTRISTTTKFPCKLR